MPLPLSNFDVGRSMFDVRRSLLKSFLAEAWGRPYQLGQWDCILFIAAWADRLAAASCSTSCGCGILPQINLPGRSPHAPSLTATLRGQYTTEAQAIRQFARHGINHAIATTLTAHGWQEIPITPQFALPAPHFLPGDIVLTDLHHPGIWNGAAILAQPARSTGLLRLHPRHARLGLRWLES